MADTALASPDALVGGLRAQGYLADEGLATALFCAVRLPHPLLLEGETGVGQTQAAHGLTPNIPDGRRLLYVQPKVGHYGVFNGRRFREEIYPRVRDFIAQNEAISVVPERSASAA